MRSARDLSREMGVRLPTARRSNTSVELSRQLGRTGLSLFAVANTATLTARLNLDRDVGLCIIVQLDLS